MALLSNRISALASTLHVSNARKHVVILIGGPASGKGHYTGMLDQHTKSILDEDTPPKGRVVDESDDHMKNLQYEESKKHFDLLSAAHKKGKKDFDEALSDHWYTTKDGDKKKLSGVLTYDNMPKSHDEYYGNKQKGVKAKVPGTSDFYISMRGWHDDATKTHSDGPLKGKSVERFKDQAREHFDRSAKRKMESGGHENVLVLDSAGEDIDVQDFGDQIKHAQSQGYEVTVVHLDMDPEDMTLSNKLRGAKGDRMVDQADIDNFAKTAPKSIEKLRKAIPDRFVHYKRSGSALSPEERKATEKKIDAMNKARLGGASKEDLSTMEGEINTILRRPKYEVQKETTDLISERRAPKKAPEESDSEPKQKRESPKPEGGYSEYVERKRTEGGRPMQKKEWEERYATSDQIRGIAMKIAAKGLFENVCDSAAGLLKKADKLGGYASSVESEDHSVYVTLKGAGGDLKDITAIKKAREEITKAASATIEKHDPNLSFKITASNKGDDIVMELMFVAPSPG